MQVSAFLYYFNYTSRTTDELCNFFLKLLHQNMSDSDGREYDNEQTFAEKVKLHYDTQSRGSSQE